MAGSVAPAPCYSPAGTACAATPLADGWLPWGRVTVNTAPPPGWLPTSMCPPCSRAFSEAIARPRPLPSERTRQWPVQLGREESRGSTQDLIRPAELLHLRPQPADLGGLLAAHARALPGIDLGLADPLAQCLRRGDAQLGRDRPDRCIPRSGTHRGARPPAAPRVPGAPSGTASA
jgi:hypothetical protein